MTNKNLLLISISLVILLLFGCSPNELLKYKDEIQKNPSFCDKFSGEDKDSCYFFAATIRMEPELCNKVEINEAKESCFFEVKGMVGFDLEDCPKLSNQAEKTTCYFDVAETITPPSNVEVCKEWPSEWSYICYTHIAKIKYNVSICDEYVSDRIELEYDKYSNITLRESCYESVAITNFDPSLCNFNKCFERIAISTKNLSLCKNQECYTSYATQLNDINACGLVEDENLRNGCFNQIADNTGNLRVCENIYITEKPFVKECWTDDEGRKHCTSETHSFLNKTEQYKISNCYRIAKENPKKCDDVAYDSMKLRNECYYTISKLTNNPEICKNIVIPGVDDVTCEDYLKQYNLIPTVPQT